METVTTDEVQADTFKPKKIVERSASYPGITIEEAEIFVTDIQKHFPGTRIFNREDVSAVLKTSAINRDIAAAKEYGFIVKQKDGFQVSELFKTIYNSLGKGEKRKCLLEAFGSPKLYAEIISKHDGHAIPNEFKIHLIRFHKIVEKAAPLAAELFLQNGKYVGAINDNGILNYKEALATLNNPNIQYAEIITDNGNGEDSSDDNNNGEEIKHTSNQENNKLIFQADTPTEEKIRVPLTEKKFAIIIYPSTINLKDIEILKKQIELLELLVT